MKLACRLGWHDWGAWCGMKCATFVYDYVYEYIDGAMQRAKKDVIIQTRNCLACQKAEIKRVYSQ